MDRDELEVHKLAKKRTRPISSHLDRTNLVNKGFIIWLLGKFCLRDTAGSPERARWLHLVRSGSQSQRAIWFILPARGTSHIINKSTTHKSGIRIRTSNIRAPTTNIRGYIRVHKCDLRIHTSNIRVHDDYATRMYSCGVSGMILCVDEKMGVFSHNIISAF